MIWNIFVIIFFTWIDGAYASFDVNIIGGFPTECRLTTGGMEYAGVVNRTRSGYTCQRWDSQSPQEHVYGTMHDKFPEGNVSLAHNYCRNPDDSYTVGVWCYTARARWQLCDVPLCDRECKFRTDGTDYEGVLDSTTSGRQCQYWDQLEHDYTDEMFVDGDVYDADQYCRNPNGSRADGPWCFYTEENPPSWEYCDINICNITLINFGEMTTQPPEALTTVTSNDNNWDRSVTGIPVPDGPTSHDSDLLISTNPDGNEVSTRQSVAEVLTHREPGNVERVTTMGPPGQQQSTERQHLGHRSTRNPTEDRAGKEPIPQLATGSTPANANQATVQGMEPDHRPTASDDCEVCPWPVLGVMGMTEWWRIALALSITSLVLVVILYVLWFKVFSQRDITSRNTNRVHPESEQTTYKVSV